MPCTLAQAHATYVLPNDKPTTQALRDALHSPKVIGCASQRAAAALQPQPPPQQQQPPQQQPPPPQQQQQRSERAHSRCCPQSASSVFTASSGSYGSPASRAAASAACISLTRCVEHADGVTKLPHRRTCSARSSPSARPLAALEAHARSPGRAVLFATVKHHHSPRASSSAAAVAIAAHCSRLTPSLEVAERRPSCWKASKGQKRYSKVSFRAVAVAVQRHPGSRQTRPPSPRSAQTP